MVLDNDLLVESNQPDTELEEGIVKGIDTGVEDYRLDYHITRRCYMLRKRKDYSDKEGNPKTTWDIISYSTNLGFIVKTLAEEKALSKKEVNTLKELIVETNNIKNSILKKFEDSLSK